MSKIALIFPGQGSQVLGMLSDLAEAYPQVTDTFAQASEVLGFDLWKLVQENAQALNITENTQPALLAASYAIYRIIKDIYNLDVSYYAGHSLGEYSALVAAGSLDFKNAIKLVRIRGIEMQHACTEQGAMYAILGLSDHDVKNACEQAEKETGKLVSAVNFNSPGQVVIAGIKEAVEKAGELCKELGAKRALPLPVSIPSHCKLMQPATDKLAIALNSIEMKTAQVLHNVNLEISATAEDLKSALVQQLVMPVLWKESYLKLEELGVSKAIEVGPGKVLSGLGPRITKGISVISVNDQVSLSALADFLN